MDKIIRGQEGLDMTNESYHSAPGISGTTLKLLSISNKHFDNKDFFSPETSDAMKFGTLFHTVTLEPHKLGEQYFVMPDFGDMRKAANKQFKADYLSRVESSQLDLEIVTTDDMNKAEKMARNIRAIYGDLFEGSLIEKSFFCDDEGVTLKVRPDILNRERKEEYDLKSITPKYGSMSDRALQAQSLQLGYDKSAGFRKYCYELMGIEVDSFFLIFASTSSDHLVKKVQISPDAIDLAYIEAKQIIQKRKFYLKTKVDNESPVICQPYDA